MGCVQDGTLDPWKLSEQSDGWASINPDNMTLPRTILTPEWEVAGDLSPWLRTFPQDVIDSVKIVPPNFPGNLLQPCPSEGASARWLLFGDHVS